MSEKKHFAKRDFAERLFGMLEIPANAFPWGMDIEIRNDREIFVGGCTGISEYSKEMIVFKGKGMRYLVRGHEFELYTFADGRVKLVGKIDDISLERED